MNLKAKGKNEKQTIKVIEPTNLNKEIEIRVQPNRVEMVEGRSSKRGGYSVIVLADGQVFFSLTPADELVKQIWGEQEVV